MVGQARKELNKEGTSFIPSVKYLKKDGVTFFAELHASLIRINDLPHAQVIVRDITEQKKSEEILTALTSIQDTFIGEGSASASFENMLNVLLQVTQSEYGFIGEVF